MRLPDFILANTASILTEWDAFARSIWPASGATPQEVRDHAEAILRAAAWDMKSAQTGAEQAEKSKGLSAASATGRRLNSASMDHAVGRAASGFDLRAVMAEYRALRASVVRLWLESIREPDTHDLADLTRFHESMDQSLAEAVHRYSGHVEESRQMFLRILGHDVRTPLNAVALLAQSLTESHAHDPEVADTAVQIVSSVGAVGEMLRDFLDFAVTQLGRRMPVEPAPMNLASLCHEVVTEVHARVPHRAWAVEADETLRGEWDRARMRQLLSNLVGNAAQHGEDGGEIEVRVCREGGQVRLAVRNSGPPIPEACLPRIFEPFVRGSGRADEMRGSLGLGLYIARSVAVAHGGSIEVTSTAEHGTTFTVILPLRTDVSGAG